MLGKNESVYTASHIDSGDIITGQEIKECDLTNLCVGVCVCVTVCEVGV